MPKKESESQTRSREESGCVGRGAALRGKKLGQKNLIERKKWLKDYQGGPVVGNGGHCCGGGVRDL